MIKYLGKDVVNKIFLLYLAVVLSELFKGLLEKVMGDKLDEKVLVQFKLQDYIQ